MQSKMHFKRTALSRALRTGSREPGAGGLDGGATCALVFTWPQLAVNRSNSAFCYLPGRSENMALTCVEGSPRKKDVQIYLSIFCRGKKVMKIQNKFKRLPLRLACHTLHLSFSVNTGKKYQKMGLKTALLIKYRCNLSGSTIIASC